MQIQETPTLTPEQAAASSQMQEQVTLDGVKVPLQEVYNRRQAGAHISEQGAGVYKTLQKLNG